MEAGIKKSLGRPNYLESAKPAAPGRRQDTFGRKQTPPSFGLYLNAPVTIPIPLAWKLALVRLASPLSPPPDFPREGPRLVVALAADYGNLGDVALTRALVEFSARCLPRHRPCLLPAGRLFRELRGVSRHVGPGDVVAIVGGGNMGDLYPDLEEARLQVVKAFPRNRIISFPQSIEFSDTRAGQRACARSRAIYEAHPHLTLFARDAESLRRMRECFPGAKVLSAPDTVLSMPAPQAGARDLPLMVCLRQDKEAGLTAERRHAIVAALEASREGCLVTDTIVAGPRLDYPAYDRLLEQLLGQFSRARCVVTDRLHGLIFAVITGTPCVVIENNNHKVRALVATWLPRVRSIRLLTQPAPADALRAVAEIEGVGDIRPDLASDFAPLISALKV